jgi:hypothetical protein
MRKLIITALTLGHVILTCSSLFADQNSDWTLSGNAKIMSADTLHGGWQDVDAQGNPVSTPGCNNGYFIDDSAVTITPYSGTDMIKLGSTAVGDNWVESNKAEKYFSSTSSYPTLQFAFNMWSYDYGDLDRFYVGINDDVTIIYEKDASFVSQDTEPPTLDVSGWQTVTIDLSPWVGDNPNGFKVWFAAGDTQDTCARTRTGVYLDDIVVTTSNPSQATLQLDGAGFDFDGDGTEDLAFLSADFMGNPGPFLGTEGGSFCGGGIGSGNRLANWFGGSFDSLTTAPDYVPGDQGIGNYFTYSDGGPGEILVVRTYNGNSYYKIQITNTTATTREFTYAYVSPPGCETCVPGVDGLNICSGSPGPDPGGGGIDPGGGGTYPGGGGIDPGGGGTIPSNLEAITILTPVNNTTLSFGTSGGKISFSFSQVLDAAKYVLYLELTDILNNVAVTKPIELIPPGGSLDNPWGSGTSATPGFSEQFIGMVYELALNQATWDILALYDIRWGVEAYDDAGTLIASTFDGAAPAKQVNRAKFVASNAIGMNSPTVGAQLYKTDPAPVLKWENYQGVSTYTIVLAHVGSLGFDNVATHDNLTLTLFPMSNAAWQYMPTGTWYWTVFGYDTGGSQTPSGFTILDFEVNP